MYTTAFVAPDDTAGGRTKAAEGEQPSGTDSEVSPVHSRVSLAVDGTPLLRWRVCWSDNRIQLTRRAHAETPVQVLTSVLYRLRAEAEPTRRLLDRLAETNPLDDVAIAWCQIGVGPAWHTELVDE